jgi:hypothetical protein
MGMNTWKDKYDWVGNFLYYFERERIDLNLTTENYLLAPKIREIFNDGLIWYQ